MSTEPEKLYWRGHVYNPPSRPKTNDDLGQIYSSCGIFRNHKDCFQCGQTADEEHRRNWHLCKSPHVLCGKTHKLDDCSLMRMMHRSFFTPRFFKKHTGVELECWDSRFVSEYEKTLRKGQRDDRSRPPHRAGRDNRGHQSRRDRSEDRGHRSYRDRSRRSYSRGEDPSDLVGIFQKAVEMAASKRRPRSSRSRSPTHSRSPPRSFKKQRSKGTSCTQCGSNEHAVYACPERKCFRCNKPGHLAKHCKSTLECENCAGPHETKSCLVPKKSAAEKAYEIKQAKKASTRRQREDEREQDVEMDDEAPESSHTAIESLQRKYTDLDKHCTQLTQSLFEKSGKLRECRRAHERKLMAVREQRDKLYEKCRRYKSEVTKHNPGFGVESEDDYARSDDGLPVWQDDEEEDEDEEEDNGEDDQMEGAEDEPRRASRL